MKKIFAIVAVALLSIASLSAQIPQGLSYQAVIRDGSGNVVVNKVLDVQISILQGSVNGAAVYTEMHQVSTTVNGVVTLEVGDGKTSDEFSAIDWSKGPYFINSSVDLDGKAISVTSQLLSVPYALFAQKALVADKVPEDFLLDMIDARIQKAFAERDSSMKLADSIAAAIADSIAAVKADSIAAAAKADSIATAIADSIAAAKADSIATAAIKSASKNGVLPGKFSIGKNNQVHFSQGVLQYHAKNKMWRFAETQFDTIGKSYKDYRVYPTETWVDRFEFGTGGNYPDYPYYSDDFIGDYHPSVVTLDGDDWGKNPIINGGNKAGQWFTLSAFEWEWLLYERENADNLYSRAMVNGMKGFILLPDSWLTPYDVVFTPKASDFTVNVYDKVMWAKLESLGAVFMPCADYWSDEYDIAYLNLSVDHPDPVRIDEYFYENDFIYTQGSARSLYFVRLVSSDSLAKVIVNSEPVSKEVYASLDTINYEEHNNYYPDSSADLSGVNMEEGLLKGNFSVSDSKQVNFSQGNLQFNKESKIWRFAENQYEAIGTGRLGRSVNEHDGWIDMYFWATSGYACDPLTYFYYDESYGLGTSDISGTKYDWGVNNAISNGGNAANIWRTLTKDEWSYLLKREYNGRKLCAPAKVNGRPGLILLPDNWTPTPNIAYNDTVDYERQAAVYVMNKYSETQWSALESQGAVFLPSAGSDGYDWDYIHSVSEFSDCNYWSSSANDSNTSYVMSIYVNYSSETMADFSSENYYYDVQPKVLTSYRRRDCAVRLVRDVK